ncbi:hypothetical protein MTR_6g465280 [Medicago truncatula]|uniref:Uncharacterized protein n=1 Tax=Medicago truncatula TaxID=3880 RepID=A0A072UAB0_MEDTR|nr:hypothetical protein MTR_6g465280 [Medicago truncatula]
MCVVNTSTPDNITSDGVKNVLVKNYTKGTIQIYKRETLVSFEDEEGKSLVSSAEPGNKMEVVVVFENGFVVKNTTVYLKSFSSLQPCLANFLVLNDIGYRKAKKKL